MNEIVKKARSLLSDIVTYWKVPMPKRYMTFREIAAYAGGGIGAYCIITLGTACILGTGNTLISSTLGIAPTDMYIMYVIAVLANIPLTGIRADIIDNTRNKAGKYRPYIVTMALPTAIICVAMVWFPYDILGSIFGSGMVFGREKAYVAKCALILIFNLLLHFFYYFFNDAYENLIHVLSPNSQERADVSSIKSIVYSIAPSIINLLAPLIASNVFHSNSTDIRVYRLLYPILTVFGILLCIVVYKNTEEKIVQARSHVVQIKFTDALRAVARNKYFWIISLAGWIGFLESAYSNIMFWLYNYGGACSGNIYGLIVTIYGNASLWGMLLAPFLIRKWGKKAVLVVTNLFNILFILMMLPVTRDISSSTIWMVLACLYLNAFMGSFALILSPSIQADIRDYQQYITGERIDGMFSAVGTIGTVITLATSSILPIVYEKGGLTQAVATKVTSNPEILNRMLGDNSTVGEILAEQLANGQNNYINANSALYDPDILLNLLHVLIIFSAVGALLNVIPYFWYDFNERKQNSVIQVLKVRAMFEDYHNGVIKDENLVEAVDIIRKSRELYNAEAVAADKKDYKGIKDKQSRKTAKKQYKEKLQFNEDIEISKFVCEELDKFSTEAFIIRLDVSKKVYEAGLKGIENANYDDIKAEFKDAKSMPKRTFEEKQLRSFAIEVERNKLSSYRAYQKYFANKAEFKAPDFAVLEGFFNIEDTCDDELRVLYEEKRLARQNKDSSAVREIKAKIKQVQAERKASRDNSKKEMDKHAYFNRAAKPYLDAEKLITQQENYSHLDEIIALYDEAKERYEAKLAVDAAEAARLKLEEAEFKKKLIEEKKQEKLAKKDK